MYSNVTKAVNQRFFSLLCCKLRKKDRRCGNKFKKTDLPSGTCFNLVCSKWEKHEWFVFTVAVYKLSSVSLHIAHLYYQKFEVIGIFHAPNNRVIARLRPEGNLPDFFAGIFSCRSNGLQKKVR